MSDKVFIDANLQAVKKRINHAASACARGSENITLLAVSKTKPVSDIITAYESGQRHFGENYVQEAVAKISDLKHFSDLHWHFIGPLQSNKSKLVAENFDWVHSIDRFKIAKRLNDQRPATLAPINVCIQVNIDGDPNKAGIAPAEVNSLVEKVMELPMLKLRGLMTIPYASSTENILNSSFGKMRILYERMQEYSPNIDTLSMGMSSDLDLAIKHGSTMVRIGTAIFGKRNN